MGLIDYTPTEVKCQYVLKRIEEDIRRNVAEIEKSEELFSDLAASHSTDEESCAKIDEVYLFIREFGK